MNRSSKGPNIAKKGKPSGPGHERAGLKDVHVERLEDEFEVGDKYTEDGSSEPSENVFVRHPNRNLDKPDIDKPPYS